MPPLRFTCSSCGERLSTAPTKAGQKVKCPACKEIVLVPITAPATPHAAGSTTIDPMPALRPPADLTLAPPTEEPVDLVFMPEPTADAIGARASDGTVCVRRSVIYLQGGMLGVVAIVFFILGLVVGGQAARHAQHNANPRACTITGTVRYADSQNQQFPDSGCVVCVVPAGRRPDQKVPGEAIAPDAPPLSPEHMALRLVRQLGGDLCRTDAQGRYRLRIPATGRYYLLVVSSHAIRGPTAHPAPRDLAEMGRYFLPATAVLKQYRYQWRQRIFTRDQQFDVAF